MLATRHLAVLTGAFAIATTAAAQSFNIDIGNGVQGPDARYGAAGVPGHWNSLAAEWGVTYFNLVDIDGVPTGVSFSQIGGTETLSLTDDDVTGQDAVLMNDALITHSTIENCIFMHDLEPGTYEVLIYARMPAEPDIDAVTNVDQEPGNPHLTVGGAWTGEHVEGVTYSRHIAEVPDSGVWDGELWLHSGVPSGGNFTIGAAMNGFQVRKLVSAPGDLDGDYDVDVEDLLQLLSAWGPCIGCDEDLDADDLVGIGDLLILLGNWGS